MLLAINAADDERNPPETGVTDAALKRVKNGKLYLIPASTETRGHLTTGNAKFYPSSNCRNCCRPRRSGRCDALTRLEVRASCRRTAFAVSRFRCPA